MKLIPFVFFTMLPATASAADWGTDSMLPASLKLIGALTIVLGLVLLLYYCSRKGFSFLPNPKSGAIKLIEARHLMPKKSLFLVEVRGKELLLGVGAERIELLSTINWNANQGTGIADRGNETSFEETLNTQLEEE